MHEGAGRPHRDWRFALAIVSAVAVAVIGVGGQLARPPLEDWRGAAAVVQPLLEPDDAVIFQPWYVASPYAFYACRAPLPVGVWYSCRLCEPVPCEPPLVLPIQPRRIWLIGSRFHGIDDFDPLSKTPSWMGVWSGVTVFRYDL